MSFGACKPPARRARLQGRLPLTRPLNWTPRPKATRPELEVQSDLLVTWMLTQRFTEGVHRAPPGKAPEQPVRNDHTIPPIQHQKSVTQLSCSASIQGETSVERRHCRLELQSYRGPACQTPRLMQPLIEIGVLLEWNDDTAHGPRFSKEWKGG